MAKPSRGAEKKEVQFNLLISEQVTFNPKDDKVFIEFVSSEIAATELLTSDSEVVGIYKLSCSMKFPAELITDGSYLAYFYMLERKTGNKEKEDHINSTRYIEVPKFAKEIDIWHQHDGFFEKKPDDWRTKFATTVKNLFNDLVVKHAEKYCMVFFQELTNDETNRFPNFLLQLKMLFHGMKKVYLTEYKRWKDDEQFKTFVSKQCIDVLNQRAANKMHKEQSTVFSLSLLLALYITEFDVLHDTDRSRLSELLMTTQDVENKTCPEFEAFNRVLKNKREPMKQAFIKLAEGALQSAQQRPYLILMPWVHFLNGECIPFKKICFDMSHDENEPRWWGVTTVKKHIDTYKGKCKKWDLSKFQREYLSALFQMDYLLPRSIIATADLKDLAKLIQTRLFPVEVILANLIYHLRSSDKHYSTRDKSIGQHIRDSLDVLLQNLEPIYSEYKRDIFEYSVQCRKLRRIRSHGLSFQNMIRVGLGQQNNNL